MRASLLVLALALAALLALPAAALPGLPPVPVAGRPALEGPAAASLPEPPLVEVRVAVPLPEVAPVLPLVAGLPRLPAAAREAPASLADHADLVAELAPALPPPGARAAEPPLAFPRAEPVAPFQPAPAAPAPPVTYAPASAARAPASMEALEPPLAAPATLVATAGLLLAAGLYVRLAPSAALASPARQRIYDLVRADPGCTAGSLARRLGLDYKTVLHHLRVLRHAGCVMVHTGAQPRYFVSGDLPSPAMRGAVVLRVPSARALLAALALGPARAADLARALGLSETTASVQLRRLAAAGLAARGPDGRWELA